MVKRPHSAGIEVILDVVYNHSAEGNHLGPTLSFRGIDNTSYYRLFARRSRIVLLRRELDRIQEGATPLAQAQFLPWAANQGIRRQRPSYGSRRMAAR
jgi:hypothetical protein